MRWRRRPAPRIPGRLMMRTQMYESHDGVYRVTPAPARNRRGRALKQIVWNLTENRRRIGRPFHSARLAKAFAEAFAALGDDRRARAEFIRDGGAWCYDKEREWRKDRDQRRWAKWEAEQA